MVFLMRLEVVRKLENPLAEDRYLNFWRAAVSLVYPVLRDNLRFQISSQCHFRIGTPRLYLNPVYVRNQNTTGTRCRLAGYVDQFIPPQRVSKSALHLSVPG